MLGSSSPFSLDNDDPFPLPRPYPHYSQHGGDGRPSILSSSVPFMLRGCTLESDTFFSLHQEPGTKLHSLGQRVRLLTVKDLQRFGNEGFFPFLSLSGNGNEFIRGAFIIPSKLPSFSQRRNDRNRWLWKLKLASSAARVAWLDVLAAAVLAESSIISEENGWWLDTWLTLWSALLSLQPREGENEEEGGGTKRIGRWSSYDRRLMKEAPPVLHMLGVAISSVCLTGKRPSANLLIPKEGLLEEVEGWIGVNFLSVLCRRKERPNEQQKPSQSHGEGCCATGGSANTLVSSLRTLALTEERRLRELWQAFAPLYRREMMSWRLSPVLSRLAFAGFALGGGSLAVTAVTVMILLVIMASLPLSKLLTTIKKRKTKKKQSRTRNTLHSLSKSPVSSSAVSVVASYGEATSPALCPSTASKSGGVSAAKTEDEDASRDYSVKMHGQDQARLQSARSKADRASIEENEEEEEEQSTGCIIYSTTGQMNLSAMVFLLLTCLLGFFFAAAWSCAAVEGTELLICLDPYSPLAIVGAKIKSWWQWFSLSCSGLFFLVGVQARLRRALSPPSAASSSQRNLREVEVDGQASSCLLVETSSLGWQQEGRAGVSKGFGGPLAYMGVSSLFCWIIAAVDREWAIFDIPVWVLVVQFYFIAVGGATLPSCWVHRCMRFGYPLKEVSLSGISVVLTRNYLGDLLFDGDLVLWLGLNVFGSFPIGYAFSVDPVLGLWVAWLTLMMTFPSAEPPITEEYLSRHALADQFSGDCTLSRYSGGMKRLAVSFITGFVDMRKEANAAREEGLGQEGGKSDASSSVAKAEKNALHDRDSGVEVNIAFRANAKDKGASSAAASTLLQTVASPWEVLQPPPTSMGHVQSEGREEEGIDKSKNEEEMETMKSKREVASSSSLMMGPRERASYACLMHSGLVSFASTATFWAWIAGQIAMQEPDWKGRKKVVIGGPMRVGRRGSP